MAWINRWRKATARRALRAAQRADERERDAARRRIADLAADSPDWNRGTRLLPQWQAAPLLTPGQCERSRRPPVIQQGPVGEPPTPRP